MQKSLKMRLKEEMSSCHLLELLTVVFDYSHNRHKNMMLRDPSALYRREGVFSPLVDLLPVAMLDFFFCRV